jgi:predicted HicB family RNase H-like nuclease
MKMLTVRLSEELHRAFKVKAAMEGRPLNALVVELIESYVKASKPTKKPK